MPDSEKKVVPAINVDMPKFVPRTDVDKRPIVAEGDMVDPQVGKHIFTHRQSLKHTHTHVTCSYEMEVSIQLLNIWLVQYLVSPFHSQSVHPLNTPFSMLLQRFSKNVEMWVLAKEGGGGVQFLTRVRDRR